MKGYMLSAADYANLCQCENLGRTLLLPSGRGQEREQRDSPGPDDSPGTPDAARVSAGIPSMGPPDY